MRLSLLAVPLALLATPALAQHMPPPPPMGGWRDAPPPPREYDDPRAGYADGDRDSARAGWLTECRRRMSARRSDGTAGALIGAAAGGVIGNVVARRGDKLGGTLIGAGAGALAGLAVDKGLSGDRRRRDYCEDYLDRYTGGYGQNGYGQPAYGYPQAAYGYAYQPMMVMVPVQMGPAVMMRQPAPPPQPECREVITYDTVVDYVRVPARRVIYRPTPRPQYKRVPDKRIRLIPDKRVPMSGS